MRKINAAELANLPHLLHWLLPNVRCPDYPGWEHVVKGMEAGSVDLWALPNGVIATQEQDGALHVFWMAGVGILPLLVQIRDTLEAERRARGLRALSVATPRPGLAKRLKSIGARVRQYWIEL